MRLSKASAHWLPLFLNFQNCLIYPNSRTFLADALPNCDIFDEFEVCILKNKNQSTQDLCLRLLRQAFKTEFSNLTSKMKNRLPLELDLVKNNQVIRNLSNFDTTV